MPRLGETVAALAQRRRGYSLVGDDAGAALLVEQPGVGPNPGELAAYAYAPAGLPKGAPLIVVLHGCGQSAGAYAAGAGWLELADRLGFVVLAPAQSAANNPNRCFNWFQPQDAARGGGEAASIRQMVEATIQAHGCDPSRVFVTGLSAGGAMAAVMLAAYPEVFAGGAIVAGLPYRAAESMPEAFGAMAQTPHRSGPQWGDLVRSAAPADVRGAARWPKVSIWHGDADTTVRSGASDALARQWADVHGLASAPTRVETVDGQRREVWTDASGEAVIEAYTIAGLGHGTPLAASGPEGVGAPGPFLLEAGISSSRRIVEFWGLAETSPSLARAPAPPSLGFGVEDIIRQALAGAGLLRR